jgi:YceI-like domain
MIRKLIPALLLLTLVFALSPAARADSQWILTQSALTYHVTHPLHEVAGVSRAAKGKGLCQAGQCKFLIAVPVKSFDSGDSNRDLHMLQVTRAGDFPMVVVRTEIPDQSWESGTIHANLQVQFAGQTAQYNQVALKVAAKGNEVRITGTIPAKVSDFKIDPPKLLTIPIHNDIPVDLDMTWQRQ